MKTGVPQGHPHIVHHLDQEGMITGVRVKAADIQGRKTIVMREGRRPPTVLATNTTVTIEVGHTAEKDPVTVVRIEIAMVMTKVVVPGTEKETVKVVLTENVTELKATVLRAETERVRVVLTETTVATTAVVFEAEIQPAKVALLTVEVELTLVEKEASPDLEQFVLRIEDEEADLTAEKETAAHNTGVIIHLAKDRRPEMDGLQEDRAEVPLKVGMIHRER